MLCHYLRWVNNVKTSLDIELDRQIFRPGEEINGTIRLNTDRKLVYREMSVSFQGEEILGTHSFLRTKILPFINEKATFLPGHDKNEPHQSHHDQSSFETESVSFPISFRIPRDAPPSFSSDAFMCIYCIKGRIALPWAFDLIEKIHITVVPYMNGQIEDELPVLSHEEDNMKIRIELDKGSMLAGDTMTGTFFMEHISEEAPRLVSFQLKAQEHSLEEDFPLLRTMWSIQKEVPLTDVDTGYTMAKFEFPVPEDAPFSYKWHGFEVVWSFCATIHTFDGRELELNKAFEVKRII